MSRIYPCVYCTEDGYCEKYSDDEVTSWCVQGPCKDERPSNADRIRSMSDEELAEWIRDQIIDRNIGIPSETWLDWLRQEAKDAP
jgi:hypothetical protein